MENKEKVLKIIHLLIVVAGIAVYAISLTQCDINTPRIVYIRLFLNIVALVLALVYLAMSYRKNASSYYKAFMWLLVISEVIESTSQLSSITPNVADIFKINVNLVLFTLIAGAKDYGKNNSYLLALCLVIFNVYTVFDVVSVAPNSNVTFNLQLLDRIGQLLLAVTASFMVCGKYIDKESRGSK